MGLDTVELVMAFEERFGIEIPDASAEKIVTVRDAIDYIYSRVLHAEAPHPTICLSQRAFHKLRRSIRAEFGVARTNIRPSTSLDAIIPLPGRRDAWEKLRTSVDAKSWPELSRSQELTLAIAIGCGIIALIVFLAANSALAAAAATLLSATLLVQATQAMRVHFTRTATVGQLAELLAAQYPTAELSVGIDGWTREQVRQVVRQIIVNQLNVEPSFSDDASFIDDLGAD